jgi:hypothetical protein
MGLWEIGWKSVDWIHLAQDKDLLRVLENTGMLPSGSIKGRTFLDQLRNY